MSRSGTEDAATRERLERLKRALSHRFRDESLLIRALTHSSLGADNNERLEFLGDGLLNFAIASELFARRPAASEGDLTRARARMVREETLAGAARRLKLDEVVRLAPAELKTGGFRRDSTLADALEAIIGAIYLDAGFEVAAAVIRQVLAPDLQSLPEAAALKDPKTRLQEWLQARSRPLPEYRVLREEGPPHQRRFGVQIRLADSGDTLEAEGISRRSAEQQAAERLYARLNSQGTADA